MSLSIVRARLQLCVHGREEEEKTERMCERGCGRRCVEKERERDRGEDDGGGGGVRSEGTVTHNRRPCSVC